MRASLIIIAVGLVVVAACIGGVTAGVQMSRPPISGTGPYLTGARRSLIVLGIAAGPLLSALGGLGLWWEIRERSDSGAALLAVFGAILGGLLIAGLCVYEVLAGPEELTVDERGFTRATQEYWGGRPVMLRNAAAVPVTICAGRAGRCDGPADVPGPVRGAGTTLPPAGFVRIDIPNVEHTLRLTVAEPKGLPAPDLVIETTYDSGLNPPAWLHRPVVATVD
ncbi:hypothetical protein [Dactylosporangium sp. NPDC051541]|uniref:hypothetical protein n=1 Tax=Dactylosporangium sp. NPDC051541 TaxID=3363977 RepID=UPI0037B64DEE